MKDKNENKKLFTSLTVKLLFEKILKEIVP
jgi:hypothetical protein